MLHHDIDECILLNSNEHHTYNLYTNKQLHTLSETLNVENLNGITLNINSVIENGNAAFVRDNNERIQVLNKLGQ